MEDKEREEIESALESFKGCNDDLDQRKSISEEEQKEMNVTQGPGKSWLGDLKPKTPELTFGQKAVGTTLKIVEDDKITQARSLMAAVVDLLEEVHQERTSNGVASSTWTRNVLRTEAFNQLVNASGSLVKYISWQD